MSNENNQPDSLAAIEHTLAGLSPMPPRVDRDRLMFLAGRANALASEQGSPADCDGLLRISSDATMPRSSWLWPASAAAFAATSLALAVAVVFQTASRPTIVYRDQPVPAPFAELSQPTKSLVANSMTPTLPSDREQGETSGAYLKSREVALRMGLDALGSPPYSAAPAITSSYRDLWIGLTSTSGWESAKLEKQPSM